MHQHTGSPSITDNNRVHFSIRIYFTQSNVEIKSELRIKVSILEHFMFFACLYSSCTALFNVKTASFSHYS